MQTNAAQAKPVEAEKMTAPSSPDLNALDKEVSDWGMSIPGIIDDNVSHEQRFDLPPVISPKKTEKSEDSITASTEAKFPTSGDLDYPGSISASSSQAIEVDLTRQKIDLKLEGNYVEDASDISHIEAQIKDEIEDSLWHADEFEDLKKEVSSKIEEIKMELDPDLNNVFDESLFKPLDQDETNEWRDVDLTSKNPIAKLGAQSPLAAVPGLTELRQEMEIMVKKYVQEYMDQMFQKNVEKVTWEIIPDLAENLIRQELNKISSKVISEEK
jgi:hypothetical protein